MKLKHYMLDGADYQAVCVMACLRDRYIDSSWNAQRNQYEAEPEIAMWDNCREQGYVAMLRVDGKQINIAWFEHRNSDRICAVKWEQSTINAPTIDTAKFGDVYKNKFDTSHNVTRNKFVDMADWIWQQFEAFYTKHKVKSEVAQ